MTDKYEKLRLNAYYYSFEPTNIYKVDKVLSAMATAGKSYHSTEYWNEKMYGSDLSYVENIQKEANELAEEYKKLASVAQEMGKTIIIMEKALNDIYDTTNCANRSAYNQLLEATNGAEEIASSTLYDIEQALAKFKEIKE